MARDDAFGYDLSTVNPQVVQAWDRTVRALLAHSVATPVHLTEASEQDLHDMSASV